MPLRTQVIRNFVICLALTIGGKVSSPRWIPLLLDFPLFYHISSGPATVRDRTFCTCSEGVPFLIERKETQGYFPAPSAGAAGGTGDGGGGVAPPCGWRFTGPARRSPRSPPRSPPRPPRRSPRSLRSRRGRSARSTSGAWAGICAINSL